MDRAAQFRGDAAWLAARWADPRTRVLHVDQDRFDVVGDSGDSGAVGSVELNLVAPYASAAPAMLLGVDGDVAYFAVVGARPDVGEAEIQATWRNLREIGASLGPRDLGLAMHAQGLANWHATHTCCPRCGAELVAEEAGHALRCVADGSLHHPRTDPAVIMLVTDELDRALLGRSARWELPMFSTLAGFVEPGESAEEAVAREVHEESGIVVDEVAFVASQPWPFPSSLMLGFRATARGVDPVADGVEMAEVRWFRRAELRAALEAGEVRVPPPLSIARALIETWFGAPL